MVFCSAVPVTFNIISSREFTQQRTQAIRRLPRALPRAQVFYKANPNASEKVIAAALDLPVAQVRPLVPQHHYDLVLDQEFILMMEGEAHWAIRNQMVEAPVAPNLLNSIYLDGLLDVNPAAVTMIH